MASMRRLALLAAAIAGAMVAVYDLVSGWPVNGGGWTGVAVFGLFLGALGVLAAAGVLAFAERNRLARVGADAGTYVASGVRGVVWSWALASVVAVLLFAN